MVRPEIPADHPAIRRVNERAFGGQEEADLVEALRREGVVLSSLVANLDDRIVGHILFSRMTIEQADHQVPAVALAPMGVLPEYQRQGIGSALIHHGLSVLREHGETIVLVVGHPSYYPRFGFSSAKARLIESPFPREAFMALELAPGALDDVGGHVRYPAAFGI